MEPTQRAPAQLHVDVERVVLEGGDSDARVSAAMVLALGALGLVIAALERVAPLGALPLALVVVLALLSGLRYRLVVTPGRSALLRRLGPLTWRTRELGPTPWLSVWMTFDGDDLVIVATGDEPAEPDAANCFWIGPGDGAALDAFAARANAAIEAVSARGAGAFDLGHVADRPAGPSSSSSSEPPQGASPGPSG